MVSLLVPVHALPRVRNRHILNKEADAKRYMNLLKFIAVLGISAIAVSVVSIAWPKLSNTKRPDVLDKVHDMVIKTDFGSNLQNVLGVSVDITPTPINISSAAAGVASYVVTSVEKKAQDVVYQQVREQFVNQYQSMTPEKKKDIQDIICKPN